MALLTLLVEVLLATGSDTVLPERVFFALDGDSDSIGCWGSSPLSRFARLGLYRGQQQ